MTLVYKDVLCEIYIIYCLDELFITGWFWYLLYATQK